MSDSMDSHIQGMLNEVDDDSANVSLDTKNDIKHEIISATVQFSKESINHSDLSSFTQKEFPSLSSDREEAPENQSPAQLSVIPHFEPQDSVTLNQDKSSSTLKAEDAFQNDGSPA